MNAQCTALVFLALTSVALAEEPRGCDKFAWSAERERTALTAGGLPRIGAGQARAASPDAFTLVLAPAAAANLPRPPEREPRRPGSFSGYVAFAPPKAGTYQVTLSNASWLDLVQGDVYLKPSRFSGALDCEGVRKLVRFDLTDRPFVLQVSDSPTDAVSLIVDRVAD